MEFTVSFNPWIAYLVMAVICGASVAGYNNFLGSNRSNFQKFKDTLQLLFWAMCWPLYVVSLLILLIFRLILD